jgi:shikimate dehydrogenase
MHEGQAVYAFRFLGFDYRPNGKSASDLGLPSLPFDERKF